jgi:sulfite reductase beta subunit-like hemoprotein
MKPQPTKLFGVYPQTQEGLYMQRIPIFAGHITAGQLNELARIALEFTNATPLHLTTRQDIELHNVPESHLQTVLDELAAIGFLTYGACGDNVRNITVCPCCQFNAAAFDVSPLAELLKVHLQDHPIRQDMPRKFKISFAGCKQPQSRPYINDLAFIATSATAVRVIGAGSLGAKPKTGIVLYEELATEDCLALTLAAIELFKDHGDRENRRKARLRHIRQRLGNAKFLELLNDYFLRQKNACSWPKIELSHGQTGFQKVTTIQTIAGDIDPHHAQKLAQTAADADAHLCINFYHGIDIYAAESFSLPDELRHFTDLPAIVACPGNTTCTNGLTDCPGLAAELSESLKGNEKYRGKTIAISGCLNNCTHSAIANIGLAGRIKTIDGVRQEVYQLMLNGDNGISAKLAEPTEIVPAKDLVERLTELYP